MAGSDKLSAGDAKAINKQVAAAAADIAKFAAKAGDTKDEAFDRLCQCGSKLDDMAFAGTGHKTGLGTTPHAHTLGKLHAHATTLKSIAAELMKMSSE